MLSYIINVPREGWLYWSSVDQYSVGYCYPKFIFTLEFIAWYITLIKTNRVYFCMETPTNFLNADFGYKFKIQGSLEAKFFTVVFTQLNGTDEHKGIIAE